MGDVDRILGNSVSLGRANTLVTGFDHLIQDLTLEFDASVPPEMRSGGGLFLILYMADAEEVETESGEDSLVITPYLTSDADILSAGIEL